MQESGNEKRKSNVGSTLRKRPQRPSEAHSLFSTLSQETFASDLDGILLSLTKNGKSSLSHSKPRRKSKSKKKKKKKRKSTSSASEVIPRPFPRGTILRRTNTQGGLTTKGIQRRNTREKLGTGLRSRKSLDKLEFIFQSVVEGNVNELSPGKEKNDKKEPEKKRNLKDLTWNKAKSVENLFEVIEDGNLAIQANSLGLVGKQMVDVCKALKSTDSARKLSFAGNRIGDIGCLALKEFMDVSHTLFYLHLWGNNVGDVGADILAEGLKDTNVLSYLVLSKNGISATGAEFLCDALTYNRSLKFLDLGENCMTDEGAVLFADLLRTGNQTLNHLDLSDNGITMKGAKELAKALKFNTAIEELTLAFNEVSGSKSQNIKSIGWMIFKQ